MPEAVEIPIVVDPTISTEESNPQHIEPQREESPRKNTEEALVAGSLLIQQHLDQESFSDAKTKERAELALQYKGGQYATEQDAREESRRLLAVLDTLDVIPQEEARRIKEGISENLVATVGEGANKRTVAFDQWRREIAVAKNAQDGNIDPQKLKELENLLLEHRFSEEKNPEEQVTSEKSPEDIVISQEKSRLEERLKRIGKLTESEQQLLRVLRVAEVSDGEGGAVVKNRALEFLRGSGVLKLDEAFGSINEKIPAAMDYLKGQGLSEADVVTALDTLSTEGAESMLNQLSKEFLGKEFKDLTKDEIKKLLHTEKKKGIKNSLLLALLLAAVGPSAFMQETIPMKPS